MAWTMTSSTSCLASFFLSSSSSHISLLPSLCLSHSHSNSNSTSFPSANVKVVTLPFTSRERLITRVTEYKFPDPIPEFAHAETEKLKSHLLSKLSKKDIYGESLEEVIGVCTEIFSTFLHSEYGGPGTLLVDPFIDMNDTLNERGFPGGPQAARAAIKWATDHVDKDWKEWTGGDSK